MLPRNSVKVPLSQRYPQLKLFNYLMMQFIKLRTKINLLKKLSNTTILESITSTTKIIAKLWSTFNKPKNYLNTEQAVEKPSTGSSSPPPFKTKPAPIRGCGNWRSPATTWKPSSTTWTPTSIMEHKWTSTEKTVTRILHSLIWLVCSLGNDWQLPSIIFNFQL